MKSQIRKIEDLGYDEFFESNRKKLKLEDFGMARVIAEHREAYKVKNENGEWLAKIKGKQMFNASSREDYPAVGDWVAIAILDEEHAVIQAVLPRKTIIKRKYGGKNEIQIIATNIDVSFVVQSVGRDYNLNRFERYLAIIEGGGVRPVIILNKIDLASKEELEFKKAEVKNRFENIDFIPTSTVTNDGLEKLADYIKEKKTYCFLGSSGVGKSTLINRLIGENVIETKDISSYSDRGKHTTIRREMYFLKNGGILVDNPGMKEVGMIDMPEGIDNFFNEITDIGKKCKYSDCTHTQEHGCQVLSALASGRIDESQYSNYIHLKKEAEYFGMTKLEKREKDKQFGKFIKKAKDESKKID